MPCPVMGHVARAPPPTKNGDWLKRGAAETCLYPLFVCDMPYALCPMSSAPFAWENAPASVLDVDV